MDRPISEIMAKTVRTVYMEDTVEKVEDDLSRLRLHAMPVVDANGAVFGILSAVDILHFHAGKKNPRTVRAWELCTYKPVSVAASTPIGDVAKMMVSKRIHHIVVTDGKVLKGIVSTFNFIEHSLKKLNT